MTAENQTIRMSTGDSKTIQTVLKQPDGSPYDLGGGTARWQFMLTPRATDEAVLIDKVVMVDTTVINGQTYYRLTVELLPTDTADFEPHTYYHRCTVRTAGGRQNTVSRGQWILDPGLDPAEFNP